MRRVSLAGSALLWAFLLTATPVLAASPTPSPYPNPVSGRSVYDNAGIFKPETIASAQKTIDSIQDRTGTQVVVYTQIAPDVTQHADEDVAALIAQWSIGGPSKNGLAILFDMRSDRLTHDIAIEGNSGLPATLDQSALNRINYADMERLAAQGDFDGALEVGLARIQSATAPAAGPPYPDAVTGQRVYDFAGIFSPATVTRAEHIIAGIEQRTGAQVGVYTQVKPESNTLDLANADALALMNQWGVGRKGFDDGLMILFDMQGNLRHGQVSLYAGAGYKAAFLSNEDRQQIFDNDMKPLLVEGDMDGGLMAALKDIDANATPEHAANLERGRQINALAVVAALLAGLLLTLYACYSWLRHGRDPIYIDDNSILMPAPPAGLTPAMATLLLDDRTSDRTTSTALMDLAASGAIAFRQEHPAHGDSPASVGITYLGDGDGTVGEPEKKILESVEKHSKSFENYVAPKRLYHLTDSFTTCHTELEKSAVTHGWLNAQPSEVVFHWGMIGSLEITAAIVSLILWFIFMFDWFMVLTASLTLAGIVTLVLMRSMPARTRQGAILYAMLSAYKRTLQATMAQARSMGDVVASHVLPWIKTPDQVVVWGVAFGLNAELDAVMERTFGRAAGDEAWMNRRPAEFTPSWSPSWWTVASHGHSAGGLGGFGVSSPTAGLFSSSAIPDPGSIVAALHSVTSPAFPVSSSSSSGGSSFSSGGSFGGGGGGGGGGAGGGF
jgi:uncharacterized membrane protein YgcG